MTGAIIGDIVGSEFEFNKTSDYNFPLFAEGSDFTDDTICTVAVAVIGLGYRSKDSIMPPRKTVADITKFY